MFSYPSLPEAAESFSYLAGLIRNPSSWETTQGARHVWVVQGYFQANAIGGADMLAVADSVQADVTAEDLANTCDGYVAMASGGAVVNAIGKSGLLVKLIGALVTKAIESGMAQELIKKALENFLGGLKPAA